MSNNPNPAARKRIIQIDWGKFVGSLARFTVRALILLFVYVFSGFYGATPSPFETAVMLLLGMIWWKVADIPRST